MLFRSAYHRVMECLDYAEADTEEQLRAQLKRLLESRKMTEQEAECIRIRDIRRFVESGLGQRMKKAAMKKHLYREQPFVIQRSASMLDDGWKNETVLVQGIIDAYFMEGDEIVLVDYKTDRVKRGQEQKLIDLYHVQLEDYARALERMTGKRVKEKIIYSLHCTKRYCCERNKNYYCEFKYPAGISACYTRHPAGYLFFRIWLTSLPKPMGYPSAQRRCQPFL